MVSGVVGVAVVVCNIGVVVSSDVVGCPVVAEKQRIFTRD